MAKKILGSIFSAFGLFMAISTFQVAKGFVFENYFELNAAIGIRIVFLVIMFAITAYLIKTGISIFGFHPEKKKPEENREEDY